MSDVTTSQATDNPYRIVLGVIGFLALPFGAITLMVAEPGFGETTSTGQTVGALLFSLGLLCLVAWLVVSALTWKR